jgi:hypothetical protein
MNCARFYENNTTYPANALSSRNSSSFPKVYTYQEQIRTFNIADSGIKDITELFPYVAVKAEKTIDARSTACENFMCIAEANFL